MGVAIVDHRAFDGTITERKTTACHTCGTLILYDSRPRGGFLRKVRMYFDRRIWKWVEQNKEGFWCKSCNKDMCNPCGEKATNGSMRGACPDMAKIADITGNLIGQGTVDIYSPQGQILIQTRVDRRAYRGIQ